MRCKCGHYRFSHKLVPLQPCTSQGCQCKHYRERTDEDDRLDNVKRELQSLRRTRQELITNGMSVSSTPIVRLLEAIEAVERYIEAMS